MFLSRNQIVKIWGIYLTGCPFLQRACATLEEEENEFSSFFRFAPGLGDFFRHATDFRQ